MEKDWRDKLRALAPLVLRLGVATVLFQHGYATLLAPSGTDAVAAIAEQQSISFAQLAAIGELKIAAAGADQGGGNARGVLAHHRLDADFEKKMRAAL